MAQRHTAPVHHNVHGILLLTSLSGAASHVRTNYRQKEEVRAAELPKILAEIFGEKSVEDGVEATIEVEGEKGNGRQEKLGKRDTGHVPRRLSSWRTPRLPHGVHLHSTVFKAR